MAIKINTKYQNELVDDVVNVGTYIDIFNGEAPIDANAASSGTLLVTFKSEGGNFWHPGASNGTAALASTSGFNVAAIAAGTFGYARLSNNRLYVVQCGAGTSATSEIQLNVGTCSSGDNVILTKATFYQGAS